jgi:hypothetical protein
MFHAFCLMYLSFKIDTGSWNWLTSVTRKLLALQKTAFKLFCLQYDNPNKSILKMDTISLLFSVCYQNVVTKQRNAIEPISSKLKATAFMGRAKA